MRVCGYVRVSTELQASDGYGLAAQQTAIRRWCNDRGIEEPVWRIDAGKSAFTDDPADRPAFSALLADVAAGQFDVVVVAKLDRWARSNLVAVQQLRHLYAHNCTLVSLAEGHDFGTSGGRFVFQLMSSVAELESSMISDRTRAAIAQKRLAGGYHGGYPFGAVPSPDGGLMVDPARCAELRTILELCAAKGALTVAAHMTSAGIPTRRGHAVWHPSAVHSFIRKGAWLLDQPEPWPSLYRAARDRPRLPRVGNGANVNLLTGLVRCACGGTIVYSSVRQRHTGERYVECRHYSQQRPRGRSCPIRGKRTAPWYEAEVVRHILALPDDLQVEPEDASVAEARVRLAERRRIAEEIYLDSGDRATYRARLAALDAEESQLPTPLPLGATTIATVARVKRLWPSATVAEQNALARLLIARVVVRGAAVEVEWLPDLARLLTEWAARHEGVEGVG